MNEQQITKILTDAGGKLWEKGSMKRIYFNVDVVAAGIGLEYNCYNTGNISSASLRGSGISNSECRRILNGINKVYYDFADGKFHWSDDYDENVKTFCAGLRAQLNAMVDA